jgi:hypothetical protein
MAVAIDTLAYARRLREAGFSEQQAEGQAAALAAAMTESLATKQDLRELEARLDIRFSSVDARFTQTDLRITELEKRMEVRFGELEKRMELRFEKQAAHFDGQLGNLEHRITLRLGAMLVASTGIISALVKFV